MIEQRFAYFKTLTAFQAALTDQGIANTTIVFIEDTKQIYTHKIYFDCSQNADSIGELIQAAIVNDLTTGGANKALSAEQGKTLNGLIEALNTKLFDENGKINSDLVTGIVGHVLGLENFVEANPDPVEDGKFYFNSTSKKIIEGVEGTWEESDPQTQVLYNRRGADDQGRTNVLYRWDGANMAEVSPSLVLGEVAGTAYEGSKGKENRDALNSVPTTVVTGFGAVTPSATNITIAFTDSDKAGVTNIFSAGDGGTVTIPAATGDAAGLMSAADKAALDAVVGGGGETPSIPEIVEDLGDVDATLPGLNYGSEAGSLAGAVAAIDGQVKTNTDAIAALDAEVVKTVTPGTGSAISPTAGNVTIPVATATADGVMSLKDKKVLDALATAAGIDPADPGEAPKPDAGEGTLVEYEKPSAPENPNVAAGDTIAEAIGKVEKKADDNATEIAAIKAYTVNGKAINTNPVLNGADILATGYAAGTAEDVAATDNLNQAIAKVEARAKDAATAAAAALQDADIVNDLTTGGTDKVLSAEQGKALKDALDALEASLEWYEGE